MLEHNWKPITGDVEQCVRCMLIRSGGRFFHRGEDYGYDPECAEDKPVPLASILDWDEARKAWLILHYNVPLTHIDVILEGLAELFPDKAAVFREAMRLRHEAGMAVLSEIMSEEVQHG